MNKQVLVIYSIVLYINKYSKSILDIIEYINHKIKREISK